MSFTLHQQIEADSLFLLDLPLCQVRLQNQSVLPWLILIPRRDGIKEIYQLPDNDRAQLMKEMVQASLVVEKISAPDKINVAALGNIVPQLHIHVIGRFTTDPAWPQPVWGKLEASPYPPEALEQILASFRDDILWP